MTTPPNKFSSNEILHRTRTKLTHTAKQAQNYDYETLFDKKTFIEKFARLQKDQIVDRSVWVSSEATHTKICLQLDHFGIFNQRFRRCVIGVTWTVSHPGIVSVQVETKQLQIYLRLRSKINQTFSSYRWESGHRSLRLLIQLIVFNLNLQNIT